MQEITTWLTVQQHSSITNQKINEVLELVLNAH